jgi:hypothetical protein
MKRTILALVLLAIGTDARAVVPQAVSFQGVLRNNMGQLQSMTLSGSVAFFTNSTGGFMLGPTHAFSNVPAQNGLFTVVVGDASLASELTVSGATQLWMEITINGIGTFPRQEVFSQVYSLQASMADSLTPGVVLPISSGGTGSSTQNFVDLTSNQQISGGKTFNATTQVFGQFFVNQPVGDAAGFTGTVTFSQGLVKIFSPSQLVAGTTGALPAGTEPINSMGPGSGVSMDDRLNPGSGNRWVVYPQATDLRFYNGIAGGDQYVFSATGGTAFKVGGGSWATLSDERLKNVAGSFKRGLKELMSLEPIRYRYRSGNAMHASADAEHIGFGAQSVQRVIPEAVLTNSEGYLMVDNDPILWTMLNSIKEQQATIEAQRTVIDRLRAENAETRGRLIRVERAVTALKERRP